MRALPATIATDDTTPAATPGAPKPVSRRPTSRARNADGVDATSPSAQQQSEIQLALAAQAARFDAMMKVLAEQQREINAIIDVGMAQTKRDDQLMNEWIRLI
jgi:methylphosphotriester-DNA--protein-cysteine methyltransferase